MKQTPSFGLSKWTVTTINGCWNWDSDFQKTGIPTVRLHGGCETESNPLRRLSSSPIRCPFQTHPGLQFQNCPSPGLIRPVIFSSARVVLAPAPRRRAAVHAVRARRSNDVIAAGQPGWLGGERLASLSIMTQAADAAAGRGGARAGLERGVSCSDVEESGWWCG
jgi:hypothetical protein